MKFFIFLLFLLGACAHPSPVLSPLDPPPAAEGPEIIQVIVKPVVTSGIKSEDEQKWGVDLSAYYTAFEVQILNKTNEEVIFEPTQARLVNGSGQVIPALDEKGTIRYYMNGGGDTVLTLLPKSKAIIEEETKRILQARLKQAAIAPGGQKEGLIFFKKVSPEYCKEIKLELDVDVGESGERKEFSFPFSCANKS